MQSPPRLVPADLIRQLSRQSSLKGYRSHKHRDETWKHQNVELKDLGRTLSLEFVVVYSTATLCWKDCTHQCVATYQNPDSRRTWTMHGPSGFALHIMPSTAFPGRLSVPQPHFDTLHVLIWNETTMNHVSLHMVRSWAAIKTGMRGHKCCIGKWMYYTALVPTLVPWNQYWGLNEQSD